MNLNLFTEQPSWYILFCLIAAGLISFILYYRNRKDKLDLWISWLLSGIRFIAVFLILTLLLEPYIKHFTKTIEKPNLIIAIDNSESMIRWKDSLAVRNILNNEWLSDIMDNDKFDVHQYTFGDHVSRDGEIDYRDKHTDFGQLFEEIATRFENRNCAGLILLSDGQFNSGKNPVYSNKYKSTPIYTVAVGDNQAAVDAIINRVDFNKISFSGNEFPVEVNINTTGLRGKTAVLKLVRSGVVLQKKEIFIETDKFSDIVNFNTYAEGVGLQRYSLLLDEMEGEASVENNRTDFFVEVLENKQKILILANSPHPDVNAIGTMIRQMDNYDLDISYIDKFEGYNKIYDLVILHQSNPDSKRLMSYLDNLKLSETSLLYMFGEQSDLKSFNQLQSTFQIEGNIRSFHNTKAAYNQDFPLFTLNEKQMEWFSHMPPLFVPDGEYDLLRGGNVLAHQKNGGNSGQTPLIAFSNDNKQKQGVIFGEGIWRWRLADYKWNGSNEQFDALMGKIIQYLMVIEDRSRFRVAGENIIDENQHIEFTAEFYNQSFELINVPEASLVIENEQKEKYEFNFSRTLKGYALDAGYLPSGKYNYTASLNYDNQLYNKTGEFLIRPVIKEMLASSANHEFLHQLAQQSAGGMFDLSDMEILKDSLAQNESIKGKIHYQKHYRDLKEISALLILILSLLSLEWFIRKYMGTN
ncbi:MAG: VWA domain-containing protein [Bacteroidales bacterium]|nr:VWA domain-containing protein [Bacteroidales bacterium]